MSTAPELEVRLATLRAEFDRTFASPFPDAPASREELLLVRAGGARLALRKAELAGLEKGLAVVPVPGGAPALLGLAVVRGRPIAVFALASLLGLTASEGPAGEETARYVVLAGRDEPAGLAVDELLGQTQVGSEAASESWTVVVSLASVLAPLEERS